MPRNRNKQKAKQPPPAPRSKRAPRKRKPRDARLARGRGSYSIGALGAHLAAQIPRGTFEQVGGALGSAAGRGLASFTGVGDYVFNDIVHTPSMPTRVQNQKWSISNCEFVRDLTSPGSAFNLSPLALQPADSEVFPWLSRIANLYQKYRFTQLIFEFRSNTSDYAAAGPLGNVILAPVYNALAEAPITKQQLEAFAHAVSTKPSNSIMCGVECDPRDSNVKWYYVRNSYTSATQFTDPGRMFWATSGVTTAAGASLGELWVHYSIEFDEPIITNATSAQAYTRQVVTNNAIGIADSYFCGIYAQGTALSSVDSIDTSISNNACQFKTVGITAGLPADTNYFVSVDNLAVVTKGTRFWFSAPGTYFLDYSMSMATNFTACTAARPLYTAAFAAGNGTVTLKEGPRPTGTVAGDWAGTFVVVTTSPNSAVDFTRDAVQVVTGAASVVITSAYLRITKL